MKQPDQTNDEIIEDFIKNTLKWYKSLWEIEEPCLVCGVTPDKIMKLANAITKKDQQHKAVLREVVDGMPTESVRKEPLKDNWRDGFEDGFDRAIDSIKKYQQDIIKKYNLN